MMIWILPLIMWAVRGTTVSVGDILLAVFRPLVSSIVAAVVAFGVHSLCGQLLPPFARLALEFVALFVTFALMLLFATGQKTLYLDLLRGLKGSSDAASVSTLEKSEVL
jgi:hypothetical protein